MMKRNSRKKRRHFHPAVMLMFDLNMDRFPDSGKIGREKIIFFKHREKNFGSRHFEQVGWKQQTNFCLRMA
jgi:hypothetical protein